MKKSRFTESQIINILNQARAGSPLPELCRERGISSATLYKWRSKFGGMDASLMARLKELEDENRRLKKMYVEERLKPKSSKRPSQKSGEAFTTQIDGAQGRRIKAGQCSFGLRGFWHQRELLSVCPQAVR